MTHVSDASSWMRLPDLAAGPVCWLPLSREVPPRLGPAVAPANPVTGRRPCPLTAWMPLPNNGLRPEGIIALGSLVTYVLDRAVHAVQPVTPAALRRYRRIFTCAAHRPDRGGRAGGRRPPDAADLGAPSSPGRHVAVAGCYAGTVILTGVRRPDPSTVLEATRVRAKSGRARRGIPRTLRWLILPTVDGFRCRGF